jgi:hypothetical protein
MNKIAETRPRVSSNCSTPFNERTGPEIPIMFSPDQMPAKVEQLTNSGIGPEFYIPEVIQKGHGCIFQKAYGACKQEYGKQIRPTFFHAFI